MYSKTSYSSGRFSQFSYAVVAGLAGVVIGSVIGWNSPSARLISKREGCDSVTWSTADCYCLGAVAGALVQGLLTAATGYRGSMMVCDAAVAVGWLVLMQVDSTDAVGSSALWAGRLIQGMGTGGLGLTACMYITHITDFDIRGRTQVFHQIYVCCGVFYAYALGNILTYEKLTSVCMIWPVLHSFAAFFLPESPYHLYKCHDSETVKAAMRRIKGGDYDADSGYCALENYMQIYETGNCESTIAREPLKRRVRRILVVELGLVVFQQLNGASSLLFHMETIFDGLEVMDRGKVQIIVIVIVAIQVALHMISVELVEFLGRKFMLIASSVGMGLCLSTLMLHDILSPKGCAVESEWHKYVPVLLIVLYLSSYSIGWGPVVMLVYTEIIYFDKCLSGLIYACGQSVMFLVVYKTFNTNTLADNTYVLWVYIASCIVSVPFVRCCVPETRALHLYRIQTALDD